MENKDQNGTLIYGVNGGDDTVSPPPVGIIHEPPPGSLTGLSLDDPVKPTLPPSQGQGRSQAHVFLRFARRLDVILVFLLVVGVAIVLFVINRDPKKDIATNTNIGNYGTVSLPLDDLISGKDLTLAGASSVTINGYMQLNNGLSLTPSVQPTGAKAGQIYYDQGTNQLAYFNGQNFVFLTDGQQGVQSLGGAVGQLLLGGGLGIAGQQLTNTGVLSVQGQTGNVIFSAGSGLILNGTTLTNDGVISILPGSANVSVSDDGKGNVTIDMVSAGTGTVTSSGGSAGTIPLFTASQNIEDSIITQSGLTVTISGDLSVVTGGLSLSNALTVSNGGTGTDSLAGNGVLVGNGTSPVSAVAAGAPGLCLLSTAGAPAWGACPGGAGVTSLNGLTGALNVANASAAGSTITIDDATTSSKGIASFNGTNFTATGGAVNTVQNIHTAATPTFAGVNTNSITPSSALTVGASAQTALLQGSTTTITSNGVGNNIILNAAGTIELQDDTNITGNLAASGDVAVNGGDVTSTGALNITPGGALTIGATSQTAILQGSTLTLTSNGAGNDITFTSANQIIMNASGTIELQDNTNITGTLAVTGTVTGSTYNGQTISNSASFTGTLTAAGTINTTTGALQTAGTTRIDNSGNLTNIGTLTASGAATIQGGLTLGASGQAGSFVLYDGGAGVAAHTATLQVVSTLAQNTAYVLPDPGASTATICLDTGNCAGSGDGITGTGTTNRVAKFTSSGTIGDSTITDDGTDVSITGDFTLQGGMLTAGADAQVGTVVLYDGGAGAGAHTTSLVAGSSAANLTFVLPTGAGSTSQCLKKGAGNQLVWDDCDGGAGGSSSTFQSVYDNSSPASFTLDSTNGGLIINDNATPIGGTLFAVQNDTGSTTYLNVTSAGVSVTGAATVSGNINTSGVIQTAGTTRIDGSGNLTNIGSLTLSGAISGGTTITGSGNINTTGGTLQTNSTTRIDNSGNLVNIGSITASGSATLQGGTLTLGTSGQAGSMILNDGTSNTGTLQLAALAQNTVYTLPDPGAGTATICLDIGNCAGAGSGVTTSGGSTNRLAKFSASQDIADSTVTDDGTNVTTTVDLIIQGGAATLGTTSQTGTIILHDGNGQTTTLQAGDTAGGLTFVLPVNSGSTNQCLKQSGTGNQLVWQDCDGGAGGSSATLQTAYDNSTDPEIALNSSVGGVSIRDNSTPISGNLFEVQNSAGGTTYFGVSATGAGVTGTFAATGNINTSGGAIQTAGTTRIDNSGNLINIGTVSAGTYNGQTISSTASFTGTVAVAGNTTVTGDLAVNGGDITSAGALNITPGGLLTIGATGQQLVLQGSASTTLAVTGGGFTTTVGFTGVPVGDVVYNFDRTASAGTYDICTSTGNCLNVFDNVTGSGTIGTIPVFTGTTTTLANSLLSQSGGTVTVNGNLNLTSGNQFQVNGAQISSANLSNDSNLAKLNASQTFTGNMVAFQNAADSTNAFNVQNQGGSRIFTVNTDDAQIELGVGSSLDGKIVFSNMSNNNTITILPGTPGANRTITLPDSSGIVCLDSGNCAGAGATLQTAYNFSVGGTTPKIKVNSTKGGVDIQDADMSIAGSLFTVRASNGSGLGAAMFDVDSDGAVTLQNSANTDHAFRLLTQGGTSVLTGDTDAGLIVVGQSNTLAGSIVFSDAGSAFTGTITQGTLATANRTYTLPDTDGVICLNSGNCANAGGGVTTSGGTTNRLPVFNDTQALTNSWLNQSSSTLELDTTRNLSLLGGNLSVTGGGTFSGDVAVNGGDITSTGTLTIASSGVGNDVVINGADQFIVQDAAVFNGTTTMNAQLSIEFLAGFNGSLAELTLDASSDDSAIGLKVIDPRTNGNHNPSIGVMSVDLGNSVGFSWRGGSTSGYVMTNPSGGNSAGITLQSGEAGGTGTSGAVVIQSGSGVGADTSSGNVTIDSGARTGSGTAGSVSIGTTNASSVTIGNTSSNVSIESSSTLNIGNGATGHTINIGTGAAAQSIIIGSTNSTSSTTIQGGSGNVILTTTTGNRIQVGSATTNAAAVLLTLDSYDGTAGTPAGTNGAMYYDTSTNAFKCYQAGGWMDCITASGGFVSLQNAYTNSTGGTTSEIILRATQGPLDIQDRSTSDGGTLGGNILNVRATAANDSTAGSLLFGVGNTGAVTSQNSANSATAFQVLNAGSIPLFTIDTTNAYVYIGNPTSDTTGALLVLDTKSSAGDPNGVNGGMYYNASVRKLRCYEDGYWRDCIEESRTGVRYFNEMNNVDSVNSDGWFTFEDNAAANISVLDSEGGRPGIVRLPVDSSGSWALTAGVSGGDNLLLLGNSSTWRYDTSIRFQAHSNGTNSFQVRAGFWDGYGAATDTDACTFRYTHSVNNGEWEGFCGSNVGGGGSSATCDTNVAPGTVGTWQRLTVVVNAAGNSADFQIDGVSRCQVTTNIPTASGRSVNFGNQVRKTLGAGTVNFDVDYVEVTGQLPAR